MLVLRIWRSRAAPFVAPPANRIDVQWLLVVSMVVLGSLAAAIDATLSLWRRNPPRANRGPNPIVSPLYERPGSAPLANATRVAPTLIITNRPWLPPSK
jgi:hypothetical protein